MTRLALLLLTACVVTGCTTESKTVANPTPDSDKAKTVTEVETQAKEMSTDDLETVVASYEEKIRNAMEETGNSAKDLVSGVAKEAESGAEKAKSALSGAMDQLESAGTELTDELKAMRDKLAVYLNELEARQ